MKPFIRSFLLLLALATTAACYPVTASLPAGTPTVGGPALRRVPKQASPLPQVPTSDRPYPASISTSTPLPYPPYPYPAGAADPRSQPDQPEIIVTEGPFVTPTLDDEGFQYLTFAMEPTLQLQPGETHKFTVGLVRCCWFFDEIDLQAAWSISPTVGATIDPQIGLLTIDEGTPAGTVYTVTADVENGRASPAMDVYIYSLTENPLVGLWREEKQLTCADAEEIVPKSNMQELKFDADGTFSATWFPFEVYKDYWGTYRYERETGALSLTIEGSNYVPADLDGTGFAALDAAERLLLTDMWLGSPQYVAGSTNCGHVFVRFEY